MSLKVTLMMVMTLDGFIAKNPNQPSIDWTSSADKEIFIKKTKEAGVIVMGLSTYKTINKPLPNRLNIVLTFNPEKEKNIIDKLEFTNKKPLELLNDLERRGFKEIIICGGSTINSLFLKENLIDEIQLTIEPLLFGGGLTLFNGLDENKKLELLEIKKLNQNVINLRYKIIK